MLTRNRELMWLAIVYVLVAALVTGAASACGAAAAVPWIALAALTLAVPVAVATRARYRKLAELAQSLDTKLHGDRELSLDAMREGELAVLASELEKVLQRLDLTTEQLEAERMQLADALADISHQLRTPLTSLSIMTELIRKRVAESADELSAQDAAEIAERLRAIEHLQDRVQWLVNGLLKLARLDAGAVTLERRRVDAGQLVRDASAPLAIAYDLADVQLQVTADEGAGFMGDPSWSAEALENVLKNCLEHSPAGGCVRVCATEDALACRISVEDEGPGIAEEDLPHIFERFYRGADARGNDGASSEVNPAGVGIGLALARSLIAAQNGTIAAKNVRDAAGQVTGARFDIVFFKTAV